MPSNCTFLTKVLTSFFSGRPSDLTLDGDVPLCVLCKKCTESLASVFKCLFTYFTRKCITKYCSTCLFCGRPIYAAAGMLACHCVRSGQ